MAPLQLRSFGLVLLAGWAARPAPAAAAAEPRPAPAAANAEPWGDESDDFMQVSGAVPALPASALGPCFPFDSATLSNRTVNEQVEVGSLPFPCLLTRLRQGGGTPGDKAVFVPWVGQLVAWGQLGEDSVGPVRGIACLLQDRGGRRQAAILELRALVAGSVTLALQAPILDDQRRDLRQAFGSVSWANMRVNPIGVGSIAEILDNSSATSADPTASVLAAWLRDYLATLREMSMSELQGQAQQVVGRMRRHMGELLEMATPKVQPEVYLPVIFASLLVPVWAVAWLGWGIPTLPQESESLVGDPVRVTAVQTAGEQKATASNLLPALCLWTAVQCTAEEKASVELVSLCQSLKLCLCGVWCCGGCGCGWCRLRPPRDNLYAKASTPWAHAAINTHSSHVRVPALNALVLAMFCLAMYEVIMIGQVKQAASKALNLLLPRWLHSAVLYLMFLLLSHVFVEIGTIATVGNNIYHSHRLLLITGLYGGFHLLRGAGDDGSFFGLTREMDLHTLMQDIVRRVMAMSILALCVRASFSRVTFRDEVLARSARYVRERLRRTSGRSRIRRSAATQVSGSRLGDDEPASDAEKGAGERKLARLARRAAHRVARSLGKAILAAAGGTLESVQEEHPLPPIYLPPILITGVVLSICVIVPFMALAITEMARFRWIVRALMRGDLPAMIQEPGSAELVGAVTDNAAQFLRSPTVQRMMQQPIGAFQMVVECLPLPPAIRDLLAKLFYGLVPTEFDGQSDKIRDLHERLKHRLAAVADLLLASSAIACALASVAVIWLLCTAVNSFRREYVACLRGRWATSRPGVMQGLTDQKWQATLMPGMMISLCLFAFFFILLDFLALGLVIGAAIIDGNIVWWLLALVAPVVIVCFVHSILVKKYFYETYLLDQGAVKRPAAFVYAFSTFTISNLASGLLQSVVRILILIVSLLMHSAFRVDMSSFRFEGNDPVFVAFLSLVQTSAAVHNPIMQSFCHIVSPRVDDTWQPAPKPGRGAGDAPALQDLLGPGVRSADDFLAACSPDDGGKVSRRGFARAVRARNPEVGGKLVSAVFKLLAEEGSGVADAAALQVVVKQAVLERRSRERRLRVRNRFWLLLTLHRNPELALDRRHPKEEEEEKNSHSAAVVAEGSDSLTTALSK